MTMSMTTEGARITTPTDREILIERAFNAPRERVWRAFTEPDLIAQWWGRGRKTVVERMEVRRGTVPSDPEWNRTSTTAMRPSIGGAAAGRSLRRDSPQQLANSRRDLLRAGRVIVREHDHRVTRGRVAHQRGVDARGAA